ncbi:MAG: bifunctional 2-C-methyl-D-erythritol 4-phosphate cytidylyltransferase/2-C-methyl-D-erythritol 2,4-cyclodiphosphate synthase [Hyphomonadaceae bacterium]|nr:bifunctional 2-C-methyl-D-erythritol 4-phosphate cytidylyltransferase/2-C-methyl-D-erythritol 2,4-cyclodiphosphate synthase [Hyphomonadaceae bacterium]
MRNAVIIVAAGQGTRAGGETPKQLQLLGGKPVFRWSVDAALSHDGIETCILVVPIGDEQVYREMCPESVIVVAGGASRTASVQAGLQVCGLDDEDIVLIHDAARPGLTPSIIEELVEALATADAAAPALPVADALKKRSAQTLETIDRTDLFRVQTPQAFRLGMIKSALETHNDLVDDLAAIEAVNGRVHFTTGHETLSKFTYSDDLERLEKLLMPTVSIPRFGSGYDVHALEPGDQVTLCGISIPHTHSLVGHSDADVAWHALTDAILGAAALGDIGDHFPPTDPQWKGADSALFLEHAVKVVADHGWQVSSCDLTLICEAPKVKPHREAMRQRTAEVTGLPLEAISIKATTTEGLGFTGRREGIAAQANAVLAPLASSN